MVTIKRVDTAISDQGQGESLCRTAETWHGANTVIIESRRENIAAPHVVTLGYGSCSVGM